MLRYGNTRTKLGEPPSTGNPALADLVVQQLRQRVRERRQRGGRRLEVRPAARLAPVLQRLLRERGRARRRRRRHRRQAPIHGGRRINLRRSAELKGAPSKLGDLRQLRASWKPPVWRPMRQAPAPGSCTRQPAHQPARHSSTCACFQAALQQVRIVWAPGRRPA